MAKRTFQMLRAYKGGRELEEWEQRELERMEKRPAPLPVDQTVEQTVIPGTEHVIGKKRRT